VEGKKVREKFASVAERYDFLNTLFSFGSAYIHESTKGYTV